MPRGYRLLNSVFKLCQGPGFENVGAESMPPGLIELSILRALLRGDTVGDFLHVHRFSDAAPIQPQGFTPEAAQNSFGANISDVLADAQSDARADGLRRAASNLRCNTP